MLDSITAHKYGAVHPSDHGRACIIMSCLIMCNINLFGKDYCFHFGFILEMPNLDFVYNFFLCTKVSQILFDLLNQVVIRSVNDLRSSCNNSVISRLGIKNGHSSA